MCLNHSNKHSLPSFRLILFWYLLSTSPWSPSLRVALHSKDQPHGGLAMSLYLLSSLLLLLLHLSCCFIGCQLGCDINERSQLSSITSAMPQPSFYSQGWTHSSKWHSKCHICSSELWLTQGKILVESHSSCKYFLACITYIWYDLCIIIFLTKSIFFLKYSKIDIDSEVLLILVCPVCPDHGPLSHKCFGEIFFLEDRLIFSSLPLKLPESRLWCRPARVCVPTLTHPGDHLVNLITLWKTRRVCPFDLV